MYELDKTKFGAFVAELRKEKGITQKELAKSLFISDKAVSKWETGTTIPDTALLVPLAEILGVTVTELLTGERIVPAQPMAPETVEDLLKKAITYTEENPARAWQEKTYWGVIYAFACLAEAGCLFLLKQNGLFMETILILAILATIFGGYFCFFVRTKLPDYYDKNKIPGVYDGAFRMNVPGLSFNNSNWHHIIEVGRVVMVLDMVVFPFFALVFGKIAPESWLAAENFIMLAMFLGGLFVPMYIVGKKYE